VVLESVVEGTVAADTAERGLAVVHCGIVIVGYRSVIKED